VTSAQLKRYARRIREAYEALRAADAEAKHRAIQLGCLLCEVRDAFAYGEFIPWVEETFRAQFSYRTALIYMQVAEFVEQNPQRAADCASVRELLAEIRTPQGGPPYSCAIKRHVVRLECENSEQYGRLWELLGVFKACGNPVPTIIQALAYLAGESQDAPPTMERRSA
jgi:hypothetical protein